MIETQVLNAGNRKSEAQNAIEEQLQKIWHSAGTDCYDLKQVELVEKLDQIVPGDFGKRISHRTAAPNVLRQH